MTLCLADRKFPEVLEVLVAKAYTHDGKSLELVLYNGKSDGKQKLGIERLTAGAKYTIGKEPSLPTRRERRRLRWS
ncbi:uncharacterized protein N0V89_007315 [Didymosphaeria variabile]|uniref:Uncharacterized protein n=1 Tax=Didymosphaeria variabile TaxID=1932322 RepID=A0A9W9CA26_9PLEO|nr:uncharacterized protein N0V89_007315 [Didymosphaeria variabile]KAJ4351970.1 hypothetical protein N0V89_007315 [Didymosphaeria variabile]